MGSIAKLIATDSQIGLSDYTSLLQNTYNLIMTIGYKI